MPRWWPDLAGSWIFYSTLPALPGATPRFARIARFAPWLGLVIGGGQATLWWLGQQLGLPTAACTALSSIGGTSAHTFFLLQKNI